VNYEWRLNKGENLEGFDKVSKKYCFTWQPSGFQFTVIKDLPGSAYRFRIKQHPGMLEAQHVLNLVKFREDWIERVI
jgi:hypothetical protein